MKIDRTKEQPVKLTPTQMKQKIQSLEIQNEILLAGCYCHMCDKHMSKDKFYMSTDPRVKSGVTAICKKCATDIATRKDENGNTYEPTKASVMEALEYIDKPFLQSVWDAAYFSSTDEASKKKSNIWGEYVRIIGMKQYRTWRWKDSDMFKKGYVSSFLGQALPSSEEDAIIQIEKKRAEEAQTEYEKNRKDVIKIIGYDPFDNYQKPDDKPHLYASLVSMIDEDTKQDGMKLRAVIQIVQSHNQIRIINDAINLLLTNPENILAELPKIEKAQKTVKSMVDAANALAKDNGISSNYNNNKSKGGNTLSGKIKELSEKNFEGVDINTFDYETCQGMLQVALQSETARHAQISYDENIAQEIKDIKVELVETLTKERDAAVETMRKLLDENNKIKRFLKEKGLIDETGKVIY